MGDFDLRKIPGDILNAEQVSVVQVDIWLQGKNSTIVPDFHSFLVWLLECDPNILGSPLQDKG